MTVRLHASEACRGGENKRRGCSLYGTRRVEWWPAAGPGASLHTPIKSLNTSPGDESKHHFVVD